MDTGMVGGAQRQEVRQDGQALFGSPLHVVDVGHAATGTPRKAASSVPALDLDPLRVRRVALQGLLIEAGPVGTLVRKRDVPVAGQTPGCFS
jgi:hypothetical protein